MNSANSSKGNNSHLSSLDSLIERAHTVLGNSSDVRYDLVNSIKDRISSGTYVIQVEHISNQILPILTGDHDI